VADSTARQVDPKAARAGADHLTRRDRERHRRLGSLSSSVGGLAGGDGGEGAIGQTSRVCRAALDAGRQRISIIFDRIVVPGNITLLELPPYSPELNPVERIWHYLRRHWLASSAFLSLADIMDACEMACNRFATNHGLIRSLCAVAWAPASPAR